LKPFHPLVRSIPQRIINKQIVCLRDLEKTLLWLAPVCLDIVLIHGYWSTAKLIVLFHFEEIRHFSGFLHQLLRIHHSVLAYFGLAS
jgi:hypothetical protein